MKKLLFLSLIGFASITASQQEKLAAGRRAVKTFNVINPTVLESLRYCIQLDKILNISASRDVSLIPSDDESTVHCSTDGCNIYLASQGEASLSDQVAIHMLDKHQLILCDVCNKYVNFAFLDIHEVHYHPVLPEVDMRNVEDVSSRPVSPQTQIVGL